MKLLQSHPDCLADFNRWLEQRMAMLTQDIVLSAKDYETILGFRYMLGEMEALKSIVNYGVVEQQQLNALEGIDDGGAGSDIDDWC